MNQVKYLTSITQKSGESYTWVLNQITQNSTLSNNNAKYYLDLAMQAGGANTWAMQQIVKADKPPVQSVVRLPVSTTASSTSNTSGFTFTGNRTALLGGDLTNNYGDFLTFKLGNFEVKPYSVGVSGAVVGATIQLTPTDSINVSVKGATANVGVYANINSGFEVSGSAIATVGYYSATYSGTLGNGDKLDVGVEFYQLAAGVQLKIKLDLESGIAVKAGLAAKYGGGITINYYW